MSITARTLKAGQMIHDAISPLLVGTGLEIVWIDDVPNSKYPFEIQKVGSLRWILRFGWNITDELDLLISYETAEGGSVTISLDGFVSRLNNEFLPMWRRSSPILAGFSGGRCAL